jgi:predicted RNase H-like nuclease (RuvC/YqgF family)
MILATNYTNYTNVSKFKTYLILGGIVALAIAIIMAMTLWSNHRVVSLERDIETAKTLAAEKQTAADRSETQAAEYKAKTEYLEQQIAEINAIATKQNEELEKLSKTTDAARRDVERARNIRSVVATTDQLCAKLADLGHGCE